MNDFKKNKNASAIKRGITVFRGRRSLYMQCCLVLLTMAALSPLVNAGFVYDDFLHIHQNPLIHNLNPEGVARIFQSITMAHYMPLTILSFAVDYAVAGLNPAWFHIVNIFLHVGSVLLIFGIFRRLWPSDGMSFFTALLFAIHPMHVESIAWISERKDVLSVFFMMLSWRMWLARGDKPDRQGLLYIASFAFFVLACLSKVSAVVLPLIFILGDWLCGKIDSLKNAFMHFVNKIPFLVVSLGLGMVGISANSGAHVWLQNDICDKLSLASYSWVFYPVKLLLPVNLSAYYPFDAIGALDNSWRSPYVYISLVVFLAVMLTVLIVFIKSKKRVFIFSTLFYTATVLPLLSWVPVDAIVTADRYSYVPSIGLFFGFVHCMYLLFKKNIIPPGVFKFIVSAGVGCLLFITVGRTQVWHSNETLFSDVLMQYPDVAVARNNLASSLMDNNMFSEAEKHLQHVIRARPKNANSLYLLAVLRARQEKMGEALNLLEKVIEINPMHTRALMQLGIEIVKNGDMHRGEELLARSAIADPYNADAQYNYGVILMKNMEYSKAIAPLKRALLLRGGRDVQTLHALLDAYLKTDQNSKAENITAIISNLR